MWHLIQHHQSYRLVSSDELKSENFVNKDEFLTPSDDFINFSETVRDFPTIHEMKLKSDSEFNTSLEKIQNQLQSIPLFIKTNDKNIYLLPEIESKNISTKNSTLVYMGNKI